jgi:hypothetical protein
MGINKYPSYHGKKTKAVKCSQEQTIIFFEMPFSSILFYANIPTPYQ